MDHPLDSAKLKVGRAREHLEVLRQELEAFTSADPYAFLPEIEGDAVVFRVRYRDPRLEIPRRLSLLAGDAAHALRCALDHLVFSLAGNGAGERNAFPIFHDADKYGPKQRDTLLAGVDEQSRSRIEALQPYHVKADRSAGHAPRRPELMDLLLIARLDDIDKHRTIPAALAVTRWRDFGYSPDILHAEMDIPLGDIPMEEGAVVLILRKLKATGPRVWLEGGPSYTIRFGEWSADPEDAWLDRRIGAGTVADLEDAADLVEDIIESFASELEPTELSQSERRAPESPSA